MAAGTAESLCKRGGSGCCCFSRFIDIKKTHVAAGVGGTRCQAQLPPARPGPPRVSSMLHSRVTQARCTRRAVDVPKQDAAGALCARAPDGGAAPELRTGVPRRGRWAVWTGVFWLHGRLWSRLCLQTSAPGEPRGAPRPLATAAPAAASQDPRGNSWGRCRAVQPLAGVRIGAPPPHTLSGLSAPPLGLLAVLSPPFFLRRVSIQLELERAAKLESARELSRMFLPDMMSSPKPSWWEKA